MTILETFRIVAPEFAEVPDEIVLANIEIYSDMVSKKNFGKFYERAVAFFTAHNMALANLVAVEGSSGSSITAGAVIREKEGDLERQYSETTSREDLLDKTVYGRNYLMLSMMCIVPVTIRKRGFLCQ